MEVFFDLIFDIKDGKPSFQKKCLSPPSTWSNGTFFFKTGRGSGIYAFFSWTKKQQATFECWGKPSFWTLIRWGSLLQNEMKKKRQEAKKKTEPWWETHNQIYQENCAQQNSLRQAQRKHNDRDWKRKMQCGTWKLALKLRGVWQTHGMAFMFHFFVLTVWVSQNFDAKCPEGNGSFAFKSKKCQSK